MGLRISILCLSMCHTSGVSTCMYLISRVPAVSTCCWLLYEQGVQNSWSPAQAVEQDHFPYPWRSRGRKYMAQTSQKLWYRGPWPTCGFLGSDSSDKRHLHAVLCCFMLLPPY